MARIDTSVSPALRATDRPKRDLKYLRALWPFLRPYVPVMGAAFVALVVAAGAVLVIGQGLRTLIDEGFNTTSETPLDRALIVLIGIIIVLALASYARFYLVSWIGEHVVADLRRAVFDRAIALSPSFYESTRVGEVLSRITTDTSLIQLVVGATASVALRNLLLLIGGSIMLAITSPRLTGFVFLVVPIVIVPIVLLGRSVRKLSRASQDRIADVSAYVEESLNAVRTLQAFGHEPVDRQRFGAQVGEALSVAIRRVRARAAMTAIVITFVFGAIATVLWLGGRDVLASRMTAGDLSAFVFYAVVVASAVGAISEVFGDLQRAAGAMERLTELLAAVPDIGPPENPVPLPMPARGAVAFEHVTFHYPARPDTSALDGFDLRIAPGERIALVGPSGAGKTTVFQLLLRFYDPQSGVVRLDGVDLKAADPADVRARLGLVPQEPEIFSADAWENIGYGRPGASREDIRAAADTAAATEFLDALPQGFDTFLGEKGVRLSGGQRQRIAIARAVLRNPAVLLLDEATSALDSESERQVQVALDRLMEGRTTLVIAHRLATVLKADRIVVLDQGRVVATGSHAELLARDGLYARLAELQFGAVEDARAVAQ